MTEIQPNPIPRPNFRTTATAIAILALSAACEVTQAKAPPDPPPPSVGVILAEARELPLEVVYTGRVEAVHTVELRPRVSGALERVLFREGSRVRRGTPLFQLDRRPFTIALRRAEAEAATVQAQLGRANEELARAERLAAKDALAAEELERRRAESAALHGRLESAQAALQSAALDLEFSLVQAPVDGRIGRAEVTEGNLVSDGMSGTRLAVLRSMDPVYVYFELDPATASRAMQKRQADWFAVVTPLDGGTPMRGPIDFTDNGVGVWTGTQKVRARVPNPDGRLLPGSVVKVIFRYGLAERTVVVPERAIGTDQGARYVLVAGEGGTVEYRPVALGSRLGPWRGVNEAIRPGDKVVLPGLPGLRPGMKVSPVIEVQQ